MSLQAISWALDESKAKGTDYLVMIIMAHHADDLGFAALSKATLADETRLHEDTIRKAQVALVTLGELEWVTAPPFPDWYQGIPANRRPRLYSLVAFLGSGYAAPVRKRRGVGQGSARGRSGVAATPSDQAVRDANVEPRTEKKEGVAVVSENPTDPLAPDPDCIRCRGRGSYFSGAGFDQVCSCCDPRPYVPSANEREEPADADA